jgi:hypothetical protein
MNSESRLSRSVQNFSRPVSAQQVLASVVAGLAIIFLTVVSFFGLKDLNIWLAWYFVIFVLSVVTGSIFFMHPSDFKFRFLRRIPLIVTCGWIMLIGLGNLVFDQSLDKQVLETRIEDAGNSEPVTELRIDYKTASGNVDQLRKGLQETQFNYVTTFKKIALAITRRLKPDHVVLHAPTSSLS